MLKRISASRTPGGQTSFTLSFASCSAALVLIAATGFSAESAHAGWFNRKKVPTGATPFVNAEDSAPAADQPIRRATLPDGSDPVQASTPADLEKARIAADREVRGKLNTPPQPAGTYESYRREAWDLDHRLGLKLDEYQDNGVRRAFGIPVIAPQPHKKGGNGITTAESGESTVRKEEKVGEFQQLRHDLMWDFGNHQFGSNFWSTGRLPPFGKPLTPGLNSDIAEIGRLGTKDRVKFLGLLYKIDFEALRYSSEAGTVPTFRKPDGLDALLATLKKDTENLEKSDDAALRQAGMLARTQITLNEIRVANLVLKTGTRACAERIHEVGQVENPPETLTDPELLRCFTNSAALVGRMDPMEENLSRDQLRALPGSPELNATLLRTAAELPLIVGGSLVTTAGR